ncbi:hypothetical protein N431DRAFT_459095 [Stipitochalara longipes BDJ]|nr:hypothetical protein N431DRAFT_459095 [Stipitochalara longipes BDJ]
MAPSVGVKLLSATSTSSSTSPTGKSTETTLGSAATGSDDCKSCSPVASASTSHDGAMIGLGVGLGVALVARAGAGLWIFRLYRRQKSQFKAVSAGTSQEYYSPNFKDSSNVQGVYRPQEITGQITSAEMDGQRQQAPAELENRSR